MPTQIELDKIERWCKEQGFEIACSARTESAIAKAGPTTINALLYAQYSALKGEPRLQFLGRFSDRIWKHHSTLR